MRRKAAEHDRVNRPEPCAREHAEHGLRDHRHVDDDAVALPHAERRERTGEPRHPVEELRVGKRLDSAGDRAVVDERRLVGSSARHVAVERVVARVQLAAGEPAVEGRLRVVENPLRLAIPVDGTRGVRPEALPVFEATAVDPLQLAHRGRVDLRAHSRSTLAVGAPASDLRR